uniref:Uncharacterized protein n=1 Tax=Rhizophora mucronata TaxID=61149 RepID=A0A2P2PQT8_RHIMU
MRFLGDYNNNSIIDLCLCRSGRESIQQLQITNREFR